MEKMPAHVLTYMKGLPVNLVVIGLRFAFLSLLPSVPGSFPACENTSDPVLVQDISEYTFFFTNDSTLFCKKVTVNEIAYINYIISRSVRQVSYYCRSTKDCVYEFCEFTKKIFLRFLTLRTWSGSTNHCEV